MRLIMCLAVDVLCHEPSSLLLQVAADAPEQHYDVTFQTNNMQQQIITLLFCAVV